MREHRGVKRRKVALIPADFGVLTTWATILRSQVVQRDHTSDLEKKLEQLKKSITRVIELQSVADPTDEDAALSFQDNLLRLQKEKQSTQRLLSGLSTAAEQQEKLLAALTTFEEWTDRVRPYLTDPSYKLSYEDKREAMLIMGFKVIIWPPTAEYPKRWEMTIRPPDIARVCDFDFVNSSSGDSNSSSK